MLRKIIADKKFVVTVGNYGAVVTLHNGQTIENKIFLENLTATTKTELSKLFLANKSTPIYLLLDTVDQSYKKKTYPFMRKGDLLHLVKRDIANDPDKESLKNYIILNNSKSQNNIANKKWECLFVSSSSSNTTNDWLDFILEMPNRLCGIYMLPIESFSLFKLLKNSIKLASKIKNKKDDLYCLLSHNKVSGIRQTVFSEAGIVFTRVVNYNFDEPDFLEKYEQDLHSTFEYLRRLFPNLIISELDIINIFPHEILTKLNSIANIDLHFVNYTPFQAACESGHANLITQDSQHCDLLISKVFANSKKKLLKFTTTKINILEKLFITIRASYYINLMLLMIIGAACLYAISTKNDIDETKSIAEIEQLSAAQLLSRVKTSALNGESLDDEEKNLDIDRILDIGKLNDALGFIGINVFDIYYKLRFTKEYGVKLDNFTYSLNNFSYKTPSNNTIYKIYLNGKISNKSGDIEDLFKDFDGLTIQFKKEFDKNKVTYSELPRNINFTKKYYDFPIEFTVTNN